MAETQYPIYFGFQDLVAGSGFVARVQVDGRALLEVDESGATWLYGVTPGGLAESGGTQQEAVQAFRKTYSEFLYDIADDAADFDGFVAGVEAFLHDECAESLAEWRAAREAVKTGELKLDTLPVQKTRQEPSVKIVKLDTDQAEAPGRAVPSPEINNSEKLAAAA